MSYAHGELHGRQWQPSEIAAKLHERGIHDADLVEFVATLLAESQGFDGAWCRNYADEAKTQLLSIDIGVAQINVPAKLIDKPSTAALWHIDANLDRAVAMYHDRAFEPWFGNPVAMNPASKGEYIQRAAWGVMNFHREGFGLKPLPYPGHRRAKLRKLLGLGL